jgi:hypothetical protein
MNNVIAILERAIDPQGGGMSPAVAAEVLNMSFPPADHARYAELQAKARDGELSVDERDDLESYLAANDLLAIFKSKARISQRQHSPAA